MADLSRVLCEDDGVPERPDHPGTRISGQLHGGTLDDVGGRIVSGSLAPGAVLTLDRLSHEYAVSVSVAREVVRVLEAMGMVTSRRREGGTVLDPPHLKDFEPRPIPQRLASPPPGAPAQSRAP